MEKIKEMDRGLREAMEKYGFRYNGERGVYVMDGVGRRMGSERDARIRRYRGKLSGI